MLQLAFELGRSSREPAFTAGAGRKPGPRPLAAGGLAGLAFEIQKAEGRSGLPPGAPAPSGDEAGRDGFRLHRSPGHEGARSLVASASIAADRRRRRAKSDRLDATERIAPGRGRRSAR